MSAVIGALRGVLSLDSAAFEKGAKRAQASMSDLQRSLKRTGDQMQRTGRRLSASITAPLAGMATVAVSSSLKVVDAQAKMAQSMDTSVKSMQVLARAGDLTGISQRELESSMARLTRRMSLAAQGTGPAVKAFEQLGISAEDLIDIPLDERVALIQTRLAEMVPEAERAGVASQIFGDRAGVAMQRLDAAAIQQATQEIDRFGVAVSETDADQIERTNDAISALGLVSRGLANQLTAALAPTLEALALRAQQLGAWFANLSPQMQRIIGIGAAVAASLGPVLVTVGLLASGLAAVSAPVALVVAGFAALAAGGTALAANWSTLSERFPVLERGAEAVGDAFRWMRENMDVVRDVALGLAAPLLVVGAAASEAGRYLIDRWGEVEQRFPAVASVLQGAAGALGGAFRGMWDAVKAVGGFAVEQLQTAGQLARAAIDGEWAEALARGQELVGNFAAAWDGLKDGIEARLAEAWAAITSELESWDLIAKGQEVIAGFIAGLGDMGREVVRVVEDAWDQLAAEIGEWPRRMIQLGKDIIDGLTSGITSNSGKAGRALRKVARDGEQAFRDETETRSPSRVFAEIGEDLVAGLAQGVQDSAGEAVTAVQDVAQRAVDGAGRVVDNISSAFGDFVARGLDDFGSFVDDIWRSFQRLISRMVAAAASNTIRIGLGLSATGAAGGVAGQAMAGQGGSLIGSLASSALPGLFGAGGFASGIGAGLSTAIGPGSAGLFSVGANATAASALSGASTLATGIGAALPIVGIVAAGAALVSALKKTTEVIDTGVRFQINQNFQRLQEFEKTRTASRFGAGRYDTDFDDLEGEARAAIEEPLLAGLREVRALAETVGMGGFAAPFAFGRDLKGDDVNEANIQQAIADAIEAQAAAFFRGSNEGLRREGESGVNALQRLSQSLSGVNAVFRNIGTTLFDVTRQGAAAASELVDAFGGLDQFRGSVGTYIEAFYNEQEQLDLISANLRRTLHGVNIALPETRAEFRALVEAQDLTTKSGRQTYAALVSVAGAFDDMKRRTEALNEAADGFQPFEPSQPSQPSVDPAEARRAEVDAARNVVGRNAQSALSAAERAVRTAFRSQMDEVSASAQARIDAIRSSSQSRMDGATARRDRWRGLRDALVDAITDRRSRDVFDPGGALRRASSYIRDVAAGGAALDGGRLRDAMRIVADPSTDLFASFQDYQREFARNTAALQVIEDQTAGQLSEAQRQIRSIEGSAQSQVRAIESARDDQVEELQKQMAALLGIESGVMSIPDAIDRLRGAQKEAAKASGTTDMGFQEGSFGSWLNAQYQRLFGRAVRSEGLEYWGEQFVQGMAKSEIIKNLRLSDERARFLETGVPRFATGGTHLGGLRLVGETGPELEATGPSRVMTAQQTMRAMSSAGDAVREMQALRGEVKSLREITVRQARDVEKSRQRIDQWNTDGLPPERV